MRKQHYNRILILMIIAGLLLPVFVWAYDPVPPPAWEGDVGQVRHLYLFPDDGIAPSADESDNPFGAAVAAVSLGQYSVGWQDPNDPFDTSGEPGNGAWDLGKGPVGEIRITVPIGNSASTPEFVGYNVDIQVNVVGYGVLVELPSLSVDGYGLNNTNQTDTLAFADPVLGDWNNRTWTARVKNIMADQITLIIAADSTKGSLIDVVEIYAVATDDKGTVFVF